LFEHKQIGLVHVSCYGDDTHNMIGSLLTNVESLRRVWTWRGHIHIVN